MKALPYRMQKNKPRVISLFYLLGAVLLVVFALPKLPPIQGGASGFFTGAWLVLALTFVGAQLYRLIGVSQEQTEKQVSIKRSQLLRMRQAASAYWERQYDQGKDS